MQIFLTAFEDVPDPRASNARHDLGELLADSPSSLSFVDRVLAQKWQHLAAQKNIFSGTSLN